MPAQRQALTKESPETTEETTAVREEIAETAHLAEKADTIREETVIRTEDPEHPEKLKKEELTNVTAER